MHAKDIITNKYAMLFVFIMLMIDGFLSKLGSSFVSMIYAIFSGTHQMPAITAFLANLFEIPFFSQVMLVEGLSFFNAVSTYSLGLVFIIAGLITFFLSYLVIFDLMDMLGPKFIKNFTLGFTWHKLVVSIIILMLVIMVGSALAGSFNFNPFFGFTSFLHSPVGFHQYLLNEIRSYNSTTSLFLP